MRFAPLLCLLFTACAADRSFDVRGEVVGFGQDDSTLFVAHEAIPGFMPAMTMPLRADAPLGPLETGDKIAFTLRVTTDRSWLTDIRVLDDTVRLALGGDARTLPSRQTDAAPVLDAGDAVPPAVLVGDDGQPFTLADYRGQVLVIDFIYARCPLPDYCPLLSRRFAEVQDRFAGESAVQLLSVTLDPDYDTPEVLARYRSQYTDDATNWRLATGTPAQLETVYGLFGQYVLGEGAALEHNLVTVIVGPDGRVRRYLRGNAWTTADLVAEIERARG